MFYIFFYTNIKGVFGPFITFKENIHYFGFTNLLITIMEVVKFVQGFALENRYRRLAENINR